MRVSDFVLVTVVALASLAGCEPQAAVPRAAPVATPPVAVAPKPSPSTGTRKPPSGFRLKPEDFEKVRSLPTPRERIDLACKFWRKLIDEPMRPGIGLGGGPVDSGYAQLVLTEVLAEATPSADLAAARKRESNPELRDRLALAQGSAGDKSTIPELTRILASNREGHMREAAAQALAKLNDPTTKSALEAALADRFTAISLGDCTRPETKKVYPVRQAAAGGLRSLGEAVKARVYEKPLSARGRAALVAVLLDDGDPTSCLNAVLILGDPEMDGLGYLRRFVELNAADPTLKDAVKAARAMLGDASK